MALSDVVQVTVTRQSRPLERAGFGTLLHLSMHCAWSDRIRYYTQPDALLEDGFAETDPAYMAASSYFRQTPKPQRIAIGRLATSDAVSLIIDQAIAATRYTAWIDGIGFEYATDATPTPTEIEDGLTTVINSGYTITAASTANDTFTVSGNHVAAFPAGEQFRVTGASSNNGTYTVESAAISSGNTVITVVEEVPSAAAVLGSIKSLTAVTATNSASWDAVVSISPTVASTFVQLTPGENMHCEYTLSGSVGTNYSAIKAVDETGWYAVAIAHQWESTASPAAGTAQEDIEEGLADALESDRKLLGIAAPDADIIDVAKTSDDVTTGSIARRLQDKGYARSFVLYSGQADNGLDIAGGDPDPYADAAFLGARLPTDPGRETWKFAQLVGVTADELTTTQRTNALAKNCNIYTPFASNKAITEEGVVADGEYIDIVRLSDALYDAVTNEVADVLLNPVAPVYKLPYMADGIAAVEAAIRRAIDPYTGPTRGVSTYRITTPDIDDVSATDKGNRALTGVEVVCQVTGAIHTTAIAISVTV